MKVRGLNEIDAAFAAMKAGAVVVHGSLSTKYIAELALKHGLPAATETRSFTFVTKIFQGGKPRQYANAGPGGGSEK